MSLKDYIESREVQVAGAFAKERKKRGVERTLEEMVRKTEGIGENGLKIISNSIAAGEVKAILEHFDEAYRNARKEVTVQELLGEYEGSMREYFSEDGKAWDSFKRGYEEIKDWSYAKLSQVVADAEHVISSETAEDEDKKTAKETFEKYSPILKVFEEAEARYLSDWKKPIDIECARERHDEEFPSRAAA